MSRVCRFAVDFPARRVVFRYLPLFTMGPVASAAVAAPKPKDADKAPVSQPTAVGTKWVNDDGGKDRNQKDRGRGFARRRDSSFDPNR